jgi:hypothetical protein
MDKGLLDQIGDWLRANKIPFPNRMMMVTDFVPSGSAKERFPLLKLGWENGLLGSKVFIEVEDLREEAAFAVASVTLNGGSTVKYDWNDSPKLEWIKELINEVYFPTPEVIGGVFPDSDADSDLRAGLSLGFLKRGVPAPLVFRVEDDLMMFATKVGCKWKACVKPMNAGDFREHAKWSVTYPGLVLQANVTFREVAAQFPKSLSDQNVAFVRGYMGVGDEAVPPADHWAGMVWRGRTLHGE